MSSAPFLPAPFLRYRQSMTEYPVIPDASMSIFCRIARKVAFDLLRGVSAISVVFVHIFEMINLDFKTNPIGHGTLAVDFFFCLSGFVIGYSYDHRIGRIGAKTFLRNRLIRLHPLVVLGSVLGLLCYLFEPLSNHLQEAGWGKTLSAFFCSLLMLPFPWLPARGSALFPFNSPAWSLFFEYLVNIMYVFLLIRLHQRWMTFLLILSAIFLAYACYTSGGLLIGGWNSDNIQVGVPRVTYSFIAGLLVYRYNLIIKNRLNFLILSLLLAGLLMFPHFDGDWPVTAVLVIGGSPLLVSLGAGAQITGRLRTVAIFLGRLSYPLYMTHISFVFPLFLIYLSVYKPVGLQLALVIVGLVCFLIAFAWLAVRFYDEPVRAYLNKKWSKKRDALAAR
jgi:peptidoglycan/LPS O-acetylase OafA/YrhL